MVRAFITWCGFVEAVIQELYEKIHVQGVSPEEPRRDGDGAACESLP